MLKIIPMCTFLRLRFSKNGFRGRRGSLISKTELKGQTTIPSEHFNKRIMNIRLGVKSGWRLKDDK